MSKVISRLLWFCLTKLCDWLPKFAPLSQPMRSKTKTNRASRSHAFSRAWHQLHAFASSSDWFTFIVIGRSNYYGFGFTTLNSPFPSCKAHWKLVPNFFMGTRFGAHSRKYEYYAILCADRGDQRKSQSLHRAHLAIFADHRDRRIKSPSVSPALDSLQVLWANLTKYGLLLSRFVPERKP